MRLYLFQCLLLLLLPLSTLAQPAQHVVVIGVDGLSPDGIRQARTPILDSLMKVGAFTLTAQAVMPSSSSSNWASMMMGAPPELHGVTSNDWEPEDVRDSTFCQGKPGEIWPTIFRVLREKYPDADLASFYDWSDFGRLLEPGVATMLADTKGEDRTADAAIHYWLNHQPMLEFIHLDHVDHAGHAHQWGSAEYVTAVEKADSLIGKIAHSIQSSDAAPQTVVFITSDHGGKGTRHGGDSPEEMTIPWIVAGAGIQSNHAVADSVVTYDTAATVAYLLGATPPDCWVGKPIVSILTPKAYAKDKN